MASFLPILRAFDSAPASPSSDEALLGRFVASQDAEAFSELVRRHGPVVYRVCGRLTGPSDAEDAFQATFLVLAARAASIRKGGSVGSWLVGVAGRVARRMRKAGRRLPAADPTQSLDETIDVRSDPRGREFTDHLRMLDEEVTRLSDRLRGPVVCCLLVGKTHAQAAGELGVSARTVRRRVEQARRLLRARLERRGVTPAVAVGLVTAVSPATATVPLGLATNHLLPLTGFPNGTDHPSAVIAQGVLRTMTTNKLTAFLAVVGVAIAVGAGLVVAEKPAPPPAGSGSPPAAFQPATAKVNLSNASLSPTARAVASEAEFLWLHLRSAYLGKNPPPSQWKFSVVEARAGQPVPPPAAGEIRIMLWQSVKKPASSRVNFKNGRLELPWVDLSGPLEEVLNDDLPRELMRIFLADAFGKPVPWWISEGAGGIVESPASQAKYDTYCRIALASGLCFRLSRLAQSPSAVQAAGHDPATAQAQARSLVRFLCVRENHTKLLDLIREGDGDKWDAAVKTVYGFENVDAMEKAWLEWVKTPQSKIDNPDDRPQQAASSPLPERIPPLNFLEPLK